MDKGDDFQRANTEVKKVEKIDIDKFTSNLSTDVR